MLFKPEVEAEGVADPVVLEDCIRRSRAGRRVESVEVVFVVALEVEGLAPRAQDVEAQDIEPGPGRADGEADHAVLAVQKLVIGGELGIETAPSVDVHGLNRAPVFQEGIGEAQARIHYGVSLEQLAASVYDGMIQSQTALSGKDAGNESIIVIYIDTGGKSVFPGQIRIYGFRGKVALACEGVRGARFALRPVFQQLIHPVADHLIRRRRPIEAGPDLITVLVLGRKVGVRHILAIFGIIAIRGFEARIRVEGIVADHQIPQEILAHEDLER